MVYAFLYIVLFSLFYSVGYVVTKNKLLYIDLPFSKDLSIVGKGVAIAIVVYGHLGNLFGIRYLTPLGGIGVSMFLILSGYGINESWLKYGDQHFWRKRLVSVYVPYLLVGAITIPLRGGYQSIIQALLDLTAIRPQYYLGWYITYLFFWYGIYYLAMRFIKKRIYRYEMWIVVGIVILSFTRVLYARQGFAFFIGLVLSDNKQYFELLRKKRNILGLLFMGIALLGIKQIPTVRTFPTAIMNCMEMLMTTGFAVSVLLLLEKINGRFLMPLYYLGIISYEIYLIHGYTLWIVDLSFVNAIAFYCLTIGVAFAIHVPIKTLQDNITKGLKRNCC